LKIVTSAPDHPARSYQWNRHFQCTHFSVSTIDIYGASTAYDAILLASLHR
jgi:hypothetical protein